MTSEAQELKPCPNPYCNYKSGLEMVEELYGPYSKVFCPSCRLCGPRMANAAGAAEIWNSLPRRATSPDSGMVEAAKALIEAEWMVTHDWGGDRQDVVNKLRAAIAAHQPKESP